MKTWRSFFFGWFAVVATLLTLELLLLDYYLTPPPPEFLLPKNENGWVVLDDGTREEGVLYKFELWPEDE
jgi:hypothetical protein